MGRAKHLGFISDKIGELYGLHYPEDQWHNLERCILNAVVELKHDQGLPAICEWLAQPDIPDEEIKVLTKHLTIGETYFFREKVALDMFRKKIIPEIISQRSGDNKYIRIWSAGCSSGEEPYSIAMLLKEIVPDIENWDITILATDLNDAALQKATKGIYTPWSFRETSTELQDKYFVKEGKLLRIVPEIKQMVTFSRLNLVSDHYPLTSNKTNDMDVIFCRNVLMYFAPKTICEISQRFHMALKNNGWLITSQVELNDIYFSLFSRVFSHNGIFYQKTELEQKTELKEDFTKSKKGQVSFITGSKVKRSNQQDRFKLKTNSPFKHVVKEPETSNPVDAESEKQNPIQAALLFAASKYPECVEYCLQKPEINSDTNLMLILVKSYANMGKLDEARTWMEHLLLSNSITAEIRYLYATILIEQKEWDLAGKILLSILYLEPNHLAAQLSLSDIYKRLGKNHQAMKQSLNLIRCLDSWDDDEIVPDLDGMTAGRLRQMVKMSMG